MFYISGWFAVLINLDKWSSTVLGTIQIVLPMPFRVLAVQLDLGLAQGHLNESRFMRRNPNHSKRNHNAVKIFVISSECFYSSTHMTALVWGI
jgi:hypothetical protein